MNPTASASRAARWKRRLQKLVVATAAPPLRPLYLAYYRMVIRKTTEALRRYPGVRTLYLRRGCAKGEILPGISDVDLAVIAREGAADVEAFTQEYQRLAQRYPVLETSFELYTETDVRSRFVSSYFWQYRFTEGKATWKRLYGDDVIQRLPSLTLEQIAGGCYSEMNIWWSFFAEQVLQTPRAGRDDLTQNAICYKSVAELLAASQGLQGGPLTFSRQRGIEAGKALLPVSEKAFIEKLQAMERKRFLVKAPTLPNETFQFHLRFLNRFHGALRHPPFLRPDPAITPVIDCPPGELLVTPAAKAHIDDLTRQIRKNGPQTCRGIYLLPSACWHLDCLLFLVETTADCPPHVEQLAALAQQHNADQPRIPQQIRLFLLLPEVALQITSDIPSNRTRSLLAPPCAPDTFALLSRPAFRLYGEAPRQEEPPQSTEYSRWFLADWQTNRNWKDCAALFETPLPAVSNLEFLRSFWKTIQLILFQRALSRGEAVYALTLPAVERAMAREGIAFDRRLAGLKAAYLQELRGQPAGLDALREPAIALLRDLL